MFVEQIKNPSSQNNNSLWVPSRSAALEAFEKALRPFGGLSVLSVDSFNVKASNKFLDRVFQSQATGAVLSLRVPLDFAGILSDCTRLEGQALLSPLEALDHLAGRFTRQLREEAQTQKVFFPLDWTLGGSVPQEGRPEQVFRLLASLSLVEIWLWK